MDLARCGCRPVVGAVQGEANARVLEVSLYDSGVAWEIPEHTTVAVAFMKPDSTRGLYTQLPDGSLAATYSGNTVTATLAPQALTCAGIVLASIVFSDVDGHTLATFPFQIKVDVNPAAGAEVSNDYYNPSIPDLYAAYDDLLRRVDAMGEVPSELPSELLEKLGKVDVIEKKVNQFDKESIIEEVIAALNPPVVGKINPDNTILIAGVLDNGTYTVKYENDDGTATTIGEFTVSGNDSGNNGGGNNDSGDTNSYTNQIPVSTDIDGSIYNGIGYKVGARYSGSAGGEIAADGISMTGFIPVTKNAVVYLKNVDMYKRATDACMIYFFDSTKTHVVGRSAPHLTSNEFNYFIDDIGAVWDEDGKLMQFTSISNGYIILNAAYIGTDSIVTVNEEIPNDGNDSGDNDGGDAGGEVTKYTNQIPISIDTNGSIYNGIGYKTSSRLNSTGEAADIHNLDASNPVFLTGFIPVRPGDVIRMKNCYADQNGPDNGDTALNYFGSEMGNLRFWTYAAAFTANYIIQWADLLTTEYVTATADSNGHVTEFTYNAGSHYIRLCLAGDPATAIVTVNEEITD
jgi:hypothetical protein